MKTTKLYRPVNRAELDLIQDSGWKKFPPRLPDQPIFYPVTNQEYASQITTEWNLPFYKNGFVTEFELTQEYLSKYRVEKVGLDHHTELWVPAEDLEEFNSEIVDNIKVIEAYDSNPQNQYIFVKETFKVKDEIIILFEFINKEADFVKTENSRVGNYKLKKYLENPRKLNLVGELELNIFAIILEESFGKSPIEEDKIYLLTHEFEQ